MLLKRWGAEMLQEKLKISHTHLHKVQMYFLRQRFWLGELKLFP